MNLTFYLEHYFSFPEFLYFFLFSSLIVCGIHLLLLWRAKAAVVVDSKAAAPKSTDAPVPAEANVLPEKKEKIYTTFKSLKEQYYELLFSSTSMLIFTGIYFVMDFEWLPLSDQMLDFWREYNDFLLLGLMLLSIVLINILDRIFIPLKKLKGDTIAALRMASMIYMLVLFAYIKFIYQDDNYDTMIFYFIAMLISRYVYVDASFASFKESLKGFGRISGILILVLLSTALLALYGFKSGYLLTSNSVAVSLCIAHFFVIFECFLLTVTGGANKIARKILLLLPR